jgi:hypothetical protein
MALPDNTHPSAGHGTVGPKIDMGRLRSSNKRFKPYVHQSVTDTLRAHSEELIKAVGDVPFHVFLCGPKIASRTRSLGARLRKQIKKKLESHGFLVYLGEDEGLEDARLNIGLNAQDNELEFIKSSCNAIVIVAESPGSFCELGLFSWHFCHKDGRFNNQHTAFHLVIGKKYERRRSYLNEGPAASIRAFGRVHYIDFSNADVAEVVKDLQQRRSIFAMDRRGRPRARA